MPLIRSCITSIALLAACAAPGAAADWPQLQRDAAHTGRTTDEVRPPFRARWIWLGPGTTLRNQHSVAGWPDDLDTRSGYSYPLPDSVPCTISGAVQPVVAAGRVFFGTMEGQVYAVHAATGATLWAGSLPTGTAVSAVVSDSAVVFAALDGTIRAFSTGTGAVLWTFDATRSITSTPVADGSTLVTADHGGTVRAMNAATGALLWQRTLPAAVQGGIAIAAGRVYVGAEDMTVFALDEVSGAPLASHRVRGQSFRFSHPVVAGGRVWVQTASVPAIGSEYLMETLMSASASLAAEEDNIARWLTGDGSGGIGDDASPDWQHLFALDAVTLAEPFTVLCGPVEGCGMSADPVAVDNSGRVLAWWKTRFPSLTTVGAFGTSYSMDIAAVNTTNGHRQAVGAGLSGMPTESDNLFAMSVGGTVLWLRQTFRGTHTIDLATSAHEFVSAQVRSLDGGTNYADIVYSDLGPEPTISPQTAFEGRMAPAIAQPYVYIAESFGITCIEHKP